MIWCDPGAHQPGSHQVGHVFAAVDVHYLGETGARAALVTAADTTFSKLCRSRTALVPDPGPYRSGEFYLRELPPLRAVLTGEAGLALIVIDGYVDLDPLGRPGLGSYVHAEFGAPVIGVAKTRFATATHAAQVHRGCSGRPLYVTAAGLSIADAARMVSEMAGPFRIPDALRGADRLARGMPVGAGDAFQAGTPPRARPGNSKGLGPATTRCRNMGPCQPSGINRAADVEAGWPTPPGSRSSLDWWSWSRRRSSRSRSWPAPGRPGPRPARPRCRQVR